MKKFSYLRKKKSLRIKTHQLKFKKPGWPPKLRALLVRKPKYQRQKLVRKRKLELGSWWWKAGLGLLSLAVVMGIYWAFSSWKATRIICQSQYQDCPQEILNWVAPYEGRPLVQVWKTLPQEVRHQFANVDEAKLRLLGPDRLALELIISPEVAAITTERLQLENQFYLVTDQGLVIKLTNEAIQPLVVLDQLTTSVHQLLPPAQVKAVKLARAMIFQGYKFTARQSDDETLEIKLNSGVSILLPLTTDSSVEQLVSALQLILSQATIKPGQHQVDLRYNQPVIRDLTVTIIPTPTATESAELEVKD